jgi:hypothetical protein
MPVDELNDPVGYWGGWWAIGILALVLAVAVIVVVLVLTRAPKPPTPPTPRRIARGSDPYGELRAETIRQIDALGAQHLAGHIDDRTLHLQLSTAMRTFAAGRLGVETSSLTLLEVSRLPGGAPLNGVIEQYYPPSFAEDADLRLRPDVDPLASVQIARTAVSTW